MVDGGWWMVIPPVIWWWMINGWWMVKTCSKPSMMIWILVTWTSQHIPATLIHFGLPLGGLLTHPVADVPTTSVEPRVENSVACRWYVAPFARWCPSGRRRGSLWQKCLEHTINVMWCKKMMITVYIYIYIHYIYIHYIYTYIICIYINL